jgi:hypothetical protein
MRCAALCAAGKQVRAGRAAAIRHAAHGGLCRTRLHTGGCDVTRCADESWDLAWCSMWTTRQPRGCGPHA